MSNGKLYKFNDHYKMQKSKNYYLLGEITELRDQLKGY